jgi:hypothetical protein
MHETIGRKLRQILGRLDGVDRVDHLWDVRMYNVYGYGHELALALAGVGLSHPLVQFFAANQGAGRSSGTLEALAGSLRQYPTWLALVILACVAFWIVTRVVVVRHRLDDKVPLYQACKRELGGIESDLDAALAEATPLPELVTIFGQTKEIVDRYYQAGGWPWPVEPPGAEARAAIRVSALTVMHGPSWSPEDDLQQKEPPTGGHNG